MSKLLKVIIILNMSKLLKVVLNMSKLLKVIIMNYGNGFKLKQFSLSIRLP